MYVLLLSLKRATRKTIIFHPNNNKGTPTTTTKHSSSFEHFSRISVQTYEFMTNTYPINRKSLITTTTTTTATRRTATFLLLISLDKVVECFNYSPNYYNQRSSSTRQCNQEYLYSLQADNYLRRTFCSLSLPTSFLLSSNGVFDNDDNNKNIGGRDVIRRQKSNTKKNNNEWMMDGWDNFDPTQSISSNNRPTSSSSSSNRGDSIQSNDIVDDTYQRRTDSYRGNVNPNRQQQPYRSNSNNNNNNNNNNSERRWNSSNRNNNDYRDGNRRRQQPFNSNSYPNNNRNSERRLADRPESKINMNAFDAADLVHLYGLSSVLNALIANKRNFKNQQINNNDNNEDYNFNNVDNDNYNNEKDGDGNGYSTGSKDDDDVEIVSKVKPEAQLRPWLFVQDKNPRTSSRANDKAQQADRVLRLAQQRNIPIAVVDKGTV
jgi:hypothetical protein